MKSLLWLNLPRQNLLIYYIFKNLLICKTNYFILQSRIYYKDKKMAENKLADMSTEYAVKILNLTGNIKVIILWQINLSEVEQASVQTTVS